MKIASASSTSADSLLAAREVVERAQSGLGGVQPDLAFLFVSRHHAGEMDQCVAQIARELQARHLVGSTGQGVIGGRLEHEKGPAIALWAAAFPGAEVASGHVTLDQCPDGPIFRETPAFPEAPAVLLLLAEPFSFDTEGFLSHVEASRPALRIIGGMASGARTPGENRIFLGGGVLAEGAVFATISGDVQVRPLVSQGCRPFGKRMVVTRSDRNLVYEIGARPVLARLQDEMSSLSAEDQALLKRGLHLGLAIDARKEEHRRGDFLVRNVLGIVPEKGALLVTDFVKPGTTVQFHLRDASSASEDLHFLLRQVRASGARPLGALLFSCNGRGSHLFGEPNHDAEAVQRELGEIPLAGFFAAGEIGPVGGRNFLHGFTASLALFEDVS